jgi:hypothetical protein
MIDADLELSSVQLCKYIKGPDFPTGGQIMNTAAEIKEIYTTGSGTVRLRATWEEGPASRGGKTIFITSIPYAVNKSALVERIAEVIESRKLPHLVDVRDVSTDDVRIALDLKSDANKRLVMAYLYKHTPLQSTFPVNLTCLVPTENPLVGKPERLELHQILWQFLHFRLDVVRARLKNELEGLEKRIHVLEGFEVVFDALDEILKIVRKSEGKADAAEKIMKRFSLDAEQTDAILELKIYRLARLEILVIQQELATRRKRAKEIAGLLTRDADLWKIVRQEIEAVQKAYGDPRRSVITGEAPDEEYTADDFIIDEDNVVVVTRDGWVKRQKEVKDIASTRVREGDAVLAVMPGSTRATVVFFTNFGTAYTIRITDRLWRADPEPVQVQGRREGRGRFQSGPAERRRHHREGSGDAAAGARARRDERRLQPALLVPAVRRAEHARRPAVRARRRQGRGGRRRPRLGRRDRDCGHAPGTRDALQGRGDQLPRRPGPRRHPHQAAAGRRPAARIHRVDRRSGPAHGRDNEGRGADDQHDEVRGDGPRRQGPRAAAARPVHAGDLEGDGVLFHRIGRLSARGRPANWAIAIIAGPTPGTLRADSVEKYPVPLYLLFPEAHRMRFTGITVLASVLLVGAVVTNAQDPPAGQGRRGGGPPTNLQVLPKDMTAQQVTAAMQTIRQALGVQCTHCHVGGPADRAKDDKPEKAMARKMMQMTMALNTQLGATADAPKITCFTCHRGAPKPATAPEGGGF